MMELSSKVVMLFTLAIVVIISKCSGAEPNILNIRHTLRLSTTSPDSKLFALSNLENFANSVLEDPEHIDFYPFAGNPFSTLPQCIAGNPFRTIDGTCNNEPQPFLGAAKTPLGRVAPNTYEDGFNSPTKKFFKTNKLLPTARKISLGVTLLDTNLSLIHSHLLMNWGQFTDHDLSLSPESEGEGEKAGEKKLEKCCNAKAEEWVEDLKECFPVLTPNDPVFKRTCVPFLRSAPVPGFPGTKVIRNQLNDLTSFLDGSQVYGSTNIRATFLRTLKGGKLKSKTILGQETLPEEPDNPSNCMAAMADCQFAAGDIRSTETAALASVHTILLREHNRIAKELESLNPHWDDERLYQETRKIVSAVLQRITYKEFLPQVIGEPLMKKFGLTLLDFGRFTGYSPNVDPSIVTEFSTAAYRFGHSLVRQSFTRGSKKGKAVELTELFEGFMIVKEFGNDDFINGLAFDKAEICERIISRGLRDQLYGDEADLIAFNIQRSRDHGLASYNDIRRSLGLKPFKTFDALGSKTHTRASANALNSVYPNTEDIEAFAGGFSEIFPPGVVVGETFGNIIGLQFKRARFGDRFWHETPDKQIGFTDDQLQEVRTATLAQLYCENVPNPSIRKSLLLLESPSNPATKCINIPRIDLSKWQESSGVTDQNKNNRFARKRYPLTDRSLKNDYVGGFAQFNSDKLRQNLKTDAKKRQFRYGRGKGPQQRYY